MAGETELALGLLAALALGGGKKTPAGSGSGAAPAKPRDGADQTGKDINAGIELGVGLVGLGASVVTALGGVSLGGGAAAATAAGSAAAGAAKGAAGAAGATSASSTSSALASAWVAVLGPTLAAVIAAAWFTLSVGIAAGMISAAGRRAVRASAGWQGTRRDYEARIAHLTEDNMETLIQAFDGGYLRTFNDGLQWGGGWGFYEIIPGSVYLGKDGRNIPAGTFAAICTVSRYMAVEQVRAINETVLSYMTKEGGFTEAQVEGNGDALQPGRFEAMVADLYSNNTVLFGQFVGNPDGSPQLWSDVHNALQGSASAKLRVGIARFGGKIAGIAYVDYALAMTVFQSPGPQPIDSGAAAICKPVTSDWLAWFNRVYSLGETIQAGVFYDDEAQLAWMPKLSQPGQPKMYPYSTKGFLVDWTVGRW